MFTGGMRISWLVFPVLVVLRKHLNSLAYGLGCLMKLALRKTTPVGNVAAHK